MALVQHFLVHYREPVFNILSRQKDLLPEFVLFSDTKSYNDIKVIDPSKASMPPESGGITWRFIRNVWLGNGFLWQKGLIRLAMDKEFDCIIYIGTVYHLSTWVSVTLARLSGKRTLMWTHGYLREEKGFKGWVREKFYKLSDGLLLYNKRARNMLIKRGFNPNSLYVVYNALNYAEQCRVRESITEDSLTVLRKRLFLHPKLPVVLFIGRFTARKNLDMLIRAAKELEHRNLSINIILIGAGQELNSLRQLTNELGLENQVVFYGECYNEDELGPLIRMADLCIAPEKSG